MRDGTGTKCALERTTRRVASMQSARRDEYPRRAFRDLSTGRSAGSDPSLVGGVGWQLDAFTLEVLRLDIGVVAAELVFELPRAGRRWRCTVSQAFRQSQSVVNHNQACVGYLPRFVSQH